MAGATKHLEKDVLHRPIDTLVLVGQHEYLASGLALRRRCFGHVKPSRRLPVFVLMDGKTCVACAVWREMSDGEAA